MPRKPSGGSIQTCMGICGFNITILAGLHFKIFSWVLGRWRGALAAGIGIAAYTLRVGASPSVVLAAIMGGLALFACQVGRSRDTAQRRPRLPSHETLETVKGYTLLAPTATGGSS